MKRLIWPIIIVLMLTSICLAPIYKNTAGQKIFVFAYDKTTGLGKVDDEGNITARITTGGLGTVTNDANPTPVDDTNCPGIYAFDLTQGETNYNQFVLYAKSSTPNILIAPVIIVTQASIDQTGDNYERLGVPTGVSISADIAAVYSKTSSADTNVTAIKTKTDQLNFTGTDVKATLDGEKVIIDPNGLNEVSIAEPNNEPNNWNFRDWNIWLAKIRFGGKVDVNDTWLITYNESDSAITKQAVSDVNNVQTVDKVQSP